MCLCCVVCLLIHFFFFFFFFIIIGIFLLVDVPGTGREKRESFFFLFFLNYYCIDTALNVLLILLKL